uniref:Uncharacterized protein n=1 Tax=Opuntia streptacantha TaxID=393608 RepID=A0A7C9CMR8_OPUST
MRCRGFTSCTFPYKFQSNLAVNLLNLLLKVTDPCFSTVIFYQSKKSRISQFNLLRLNTTRFASSLFQIVTSNMHFLVSNVACNRDHFHSVQERVGNHFDDISCANK